MIQVGQCGNQLGRRFWDCALHEHSEHVKQTAASGRGAAVPIYDDALSTFFRNVDSATGSSTLPVSSPLQKLRARAVLVDTEERVVQEELSGSLQELFDPLVQTIVDQSGAGNNWAHGYVEYGTRHVEAVLDAVQSQLEWCDSPQSLFMTHSVGGGTGSGLGSASLEAIATFYPELPRFSLAVLPSQDDDVVVSPYNTLLSLWKLNEFCDCVLPVDNDSLRAAVQRADGQSARFGAEYVKYGWVARGEGWVKFWRDGGAAVLLLLLMLLLLRWTALDCCSCCVAKFLMGLSATTTGGLGLSPHGLCYCCWCCYCCVELWTIGPV